MTAGVSETGGLDQKTRDQAIEIAMAGGSLPRARLRLACGD